MKLPICVINASCFLALLYVNIVSSQVHISLSSTFPTKGKSACPNCQYMLTCITSGSRLLAWSSMEYIGGGGIQLEFSTANQRGDTVHSGVDPTVFANLTRVVDNGNNIALESKLYLTANQSSSVKCLTVDAKSMETIAFNVLGPDPPGIPQDAAVTEIPSDESECVLLVEWDPPSDISHVDISKYIVRDSKETDSIVVTNQTLSTIIFDTECERDLRLNVSAEDVCGRQGQSTNNIFPEFLSFTTEAPSRGTSGVSASEVATIVVLFTFINVIVIIVTVIFFVFYLHRRSFTKEETRSLVEKKLSTEL